MPQQRRYYRANGVYEACIRVREDLPFPPTHLICALLEGVIARVQRNHKVTLCHYLWMGNHAHFIFVMRDAEQCTNFLSEVQKQVTDSIKRLLGVSHLSLWEGEPSVMAILDLEKAKERVSYLYCNPARADLVDTIDKYPGLSTWKEYCDSADELDAVHAREVPWIQSKHLTALPSRRLSARQDAWITQRLMRTAKKRHVLILYPNAFLKAFGVEEKNVVIKMKEWVRNDIAQHESMYCLQRAHQSKRVLGEAKLRSTPILALHRPMKRTRRIFVLSSVNQLRSDFIDFIKWLNGRCRELYVQMLCGAHITWPPGIFPPRSPMLANALAV